MPFFFLESLEPPDDERNLQIDGDGGDGGDGEVMEDEH